MKTIRITTDDIISIIDINSSMDLNKELDSFIEFVHPRYIEDKKIVLAVDDCGLIKGLSFNRTGCLMYGTEHHGYPLAGDIFVLYEGYNEDGEPDYLPLTEEQAETMKGKFLQEYPYLKEQA